jgi:hypothetical protein
VVRHKASAKADQSEAHAGLAECFQKSRPVVVIAEDLFPLVASGGDVICRTFEFDAKRPLRHHHPAASSTICQLRSVDPEEPPRKSPPLFLPEFEIIGHAVLARPKSSALAGASRC